MKSDDFSAYKGSVRARAHHPGHLLAGRAFQYLGRAAKGLQYAFLAVVVAGLTQVMRGFAFGVVCLQRQHKATHGQRRQLITLRLIILCMRGSQGCFRLMKRIYQFKIRGLHLGELLAERYQQIEDLSLQARIRHAAKFLAYFLGDRKSVFQEPPGFPARSDGSHDSGKVHSENLHARSAELTNANLASVVQSNKPGVLP